MKLLLYLIAYIQERIKAEKLVKTNASPRQIHHTQKTIYSTRKKDHTAVSELRGSFNGRPFIKPEAEEIVGRS